MAKGKYQEWISDPDKLKLLSGWARDGLTDEIIAKKIGISRSTLNEWKKKYPAISDTLKKGKELADIEVEDSLFKRATGYTAQIKKTFKVRSVKYNDAGKKVEEKEELQIGIDEVHIPADTTAIIFWLKNRMPDKWKDRKIEVIPEGNESQSSGVIILSEVVGEDETDDEETE